MIQIKTRALLRTLVVALFALALPLAADAALPWQWARPPAQHRPFFTPALGSETASGHVTAT